MTGESMTADDTLRTVPLLPTDSVVAGESGHLLVLNVVLAVRESTRRVQAEPKVVLADAWDRRDGTLASQLLREDSLADPTKLIQVRWIKLSDFLQSRLGYALLDSGGREE